MCIKTVSVNPQRSRQRILHQIVPDARITSDVIAEPPQATDIHNNVAYSFRHVSFEHRFVLFSRVRGRPVLWFFSLSRVMRAVQAENGCMFVWQLSTTGPVPLLPSAYVVSMHVPLFFLTKILRCRDIFYFFLFFFLLNKRHVLDNGNFPKLIVRMTTCSLQMFCE